MAQLPLNPDGLATKLKQLYRLNKPDRELIAEIIIDDFKTYIKDNFLLSAEQKAYLDQVDAITCSYFAAQCAMCLKYKLPIEINKMLPPTDIGYITRTIFGNEILLSSINGIDAIKAEGKLKIVVCHTYDS